MRVQAGDESGKDTKLRWSIAVSVGAFIGGCIAVVVVLVVLFSVLGAQEWIPPIPDTV